MSDLEDEANALEEILNDAAADYSPPIAWTSMSHNREHDEREFVFESMEYIGPPVIDALRDLGREITYIEAYQMDNDVSVTIHTPVTGEVPHK